MPSLSLSMIFFRHLKITKNLVLFKHEENGRTKQNKTKSCCKNSIGTTFFDSSKEKVIRTQS